MCDITNSIVCNFVAYDIVFLSKTQATPQYEISVRIHMAWGLGDLAQGLIQRFNLTLAFCPSQLKLQRAVATCNVPATQGYQLVAIWDRLEMVWATSKGPLFGHCSAPQIGTGSNKIHSQSFWRKVSSSKFHWYSTAKLEQPNFNDRRLPCKPCKVQDKRASLTAAHTILQ